MHCFPPQNIEHWKAPGVTCRKCSEIREYFGPASLGTAEEDKVHFTSPELLASIVDKVRQCFTDPSLGWTTESSKCFHFTGYYGTQCKHGVRCWTVVTVKVGPKKISCESLIHINVHPSNLQIKWAPNNDRFLQLFGFLTGFFFYHTCFNFIGSLITSYELLMMVCMPHETSRVINQMKQIRPNFSGSHTFPPGRIKVPLSALIPSNGARRNFIFKAKRK